VSYVNAPRPPCPVKFEAMNRWTWSIMADQSGNLALAKRSPQE